MAHTKSARKRIRQDRKRQLRNQMVKTRIRSLTKKFRSAVEGSDSGQTAQSLKETIRALDRAATKGVIPRRTASRRVGRLARAAHRAASSSSETPTAAS